MRYAIVIPSLAPTDELAFLVKELIHLGETQIIIVNDGSDASFDPIFEGLSSHEEVVLLRHELNRGKGAALKTAFAYCVKYCHDCAGVVTADSDGQHTPADIRRIGAALLRHPDHLILGIREFKSGNTPWKSYLGNRSISVAFKLLYGVDIKDTQTGLRGIPLRELQWMTEIRGDRFEYEMNMLIQARRRRLRMRQVSISTLYFDKNKGTHFKAFRDTMRIVAMLLRSFFGNVLAHAMGYFERRRKRQHSLRERSSVRRPYGVLFYATRALLRVTSSHFRWIDEECDLPLGPIVFVGHHQNLRGAVRVMTWIGHPVRMWMLDVFCDQQSCYRHYADYTFSLRMGLPRGVARAAAQIASRYVPNLANSMRAIPVYRNSHKLLSDTFQQSVEALANGESVLLFPDVDYQDDAQQMGAMYAGFIHLDKYCFSRMGQHISFVPIQTDMKKRLLRIGQASRVSDDESLSAAKRRISLELQAELNSFGDHRRLHD